MNKNLSLLFLTLIMIGNMSSYADIHYHLKHNKDIVHIKASFKSSCGAMEQLYIPGNIWGANYAKQIKNIKVIKSDEDNINTRARSIFIEYDIVNLPDNLFTDSFSDKHYHYIDKDKFYLLGIGTFVYPKKFCSDSDDVIIHLSSNELKFASNVSPFYNQKEINLKFKDLDNLVILGNKDFGFIKDDSSNADMLVWSTDKQLISRIKNITYPILKKQQSFWQDYSNKKLLTFIPNPFSTNRNRCGGTVLDNTILAFINPTANTDLDLADLINHEAMHFWFGSGHLKGPGWFREGFADYYIDKINYYYSKNKEEFFNNYNNKLLLYFSSPFKDVSEDKINKNFFKIQALQKLIYWKGYLIAGQLDSVIDLDSALKKQIKDCRQSRNACEFSLESLLHYSGNISSEKKTLIKNLINNFDQKYLNPSLLGQKKLEYKKIKSNKYKLNLGEAVSKGYISGQELKYLSLRYNPNQNYKLIDIFRSCKGELFLKVKFDEWQDELLIPKENISITIPFYKKSTM